MSLDLERDVPVTENKVVDVGLSFKNTVGINDLVLFVHSQERYKGPLFISAFLGPPLGERSRSIGMDPRIEPL